MASLQNFRVSRLMLASCVGAILSTLSTGELVLAQASDIMPITVRLTSGKELTAPVDIRTNADQLWLRFDGRGAQLLRPIRWDMVAGARYKGAEIELAKLPALAESIKTEKTLVDRLESQAPAGRTHAETAHQILFAPPRIASLEFDVRRGNWDADADDDGLMIRVAPLDANGRLAPVSVRVEVVLEANRRDQPFRENEFERAQMWSVAVTAEQLKAGTPIKLPFSPNHKRWGAVGRVTVRAIAPGQGVFQRRSLVRLAPDYGDALPRRSPYGA